MFFLPWLMLNFPFWQLATNFRCLWKPYMTKPEARHKMLFFLFATIVTQFNWQLHYVFSLFFHFCLQCCYLQHSHPYIFLLFITNLTIPPSVKECKHMYYQSSACLMSDFFNLFILWAYKCADYINKIYMILLVVQKSFKIFTCRFIFKHLCRPKFLLSVC